MESIPEMLDGKSALTLFPNWELLAHAPTTNFGIRISLIRFISLLDIMKLVCYASRKNLSVYKGV